MRHLFKATVATAAVFGLMTGTAGAQGMKAAKDVKIAVVVHGAASYAYWSVVKRGVDDAAAMTGAQVQYLAPQVFDEVEHARLIEAAIATNPDGIAVSIPDADALRGPITAALAVFLAGLVSTGAPVWPSSLVSVPSPSVGLPMSVPSGSGPSPSSSRLASPSLVTSMPLAVLTSVALAGA